MSIYVERYLSDAPSLVLLHGWGASSRIWESWLPELTNNYSVTLIDLPGLGRSSLSDTQTVTDILSAITPLVPDNSVLLGWSLGGLMAMLLADKLSNKVCGVITLATNPCFVARGDWPHAMPAKVFQQFKVSLEINPAKTLARFFLLQVKEGREASAVLAQLKALNSQENHPNLAASLELLTIDARPVLRALAIPSLHLLSEHDQLVPVSVSADLAALSVNVQVKKIAQAGHLAFLTDKTLITKEVDHFIKAHLSRESK